LLTLFTEEKQKFCLNSSTRQYIIRNIQWQYGS